MIILAHGGAGANRPTKKALKKLGESLESGYGILKNGGSAMEAVVRAIVIMEDSGVFNAGTGGNLQLDGVMRLDASLMEGKDLKAGSVIGLTGIRNPIKAARIVMDLPHVILTDAGARKIAVKEGLEPLGGPGKMALLKLKKGRSKDYPAFKAYEKYFKERKGPYPGSKRSEKFSTVGAVAIDKDGDLAAGSSTGGVISMLPGRVGDTPIIGAGVYAENSLGAISCTGSGEAILRIALAKEAVMRMKSSTPLSASRLSLKSILKIKGEAGIIALDRNGRFAIVHTTGYMASGYARKGGIVVKEGFNRVRI